ncbi:hypothetical protein M408DRAFT_326385 [Serendipita vermifera MAFF 305830]|uniref:HNH nuclease domain-containing protein n=1 Tax=Serendipita vermifera MAFF 305830 TaxID=933852 RepID=A0A0C2XUR4_SERVB|nr:hypothetical protein M408DRAFT_326385 [Serendipita vermifera MAFF 305830]
MSASSSSNNEDLLRMSINTALATIEKHAPEKDRALLRAMLQFAPTDNGKSIIAGHILQAFDSKSVSKLGELANSYWTTIIVPIRSAGGKTPAPSQNPSRGDPHGGETPFNVESAKRNQAYLKKHTLARDNYTCLATGRVDYQVFDVIPNFVADLSKLDVTQACHIIPFSLNDFDTKDQSDVDQKTAIWTALQAFCGKDISALRGVGINSLDNVMTLCPMAHKFFGELQLAFEAVPDTANKYKLLTFGKVAPRLGFPETVTLKSNTSAPVPSPFYLALHCAICKVLWASGRAEALEALLEEWEDTTVLAKDGSSAQLLDLAIFRSINVC